MSHSFSDSERKPLWGMIMKTWSGQWELSGTIQAEEQVANITTLSIVLCTTFGNRRGRRMCLCWGRGQVGRKGERNWDIKLMGRITGCGYKYKFHLGEQDQSPAIHRLVPCRMHCASRCFRGFRPDSLWAMYSNLLLACLLAFSSPTIKEKKIKHWLALVLRRQEKLLWPVLCFTLLLPAMELFVIHPMSQGHTCPLLLYSPKKVSKGQTEPFPLYRHLPIAF